ncbi:hypothetical protein NL108_000852 [Boleophthalmus pectinirostris]|nr:hypothetical protein NL108_000852 [Boleophthalmus pectinirostris]
MSAPRSSRRSTSSVSPLEQAARNTAPSSNFTFVFFFFKTGGSKSVSEPNHRFNCSFLFCLASAIFIPLLSRGSYLSPREDILYSATIPQRTGAWEGRAGEEGVSQRAKGRGRLDSCFKVSRELHLSSCSITSSSADYEARVSRVILTHHEHQIRHGLLKILLSQKPAF